jgi:ATP adenylyltransferase
MAGVCAFCSKSASGVSYPDLKPWDCILFESANFIAFPSLGAIVPGWLLIAPKQHYVCMAALDAFLWDELNMLGNLVSLALHDCFGRLVLFEHGPAAPSHPVGCGVDHAHFHFVPTDCNLIDGLRRVFSATLHWEPAEGIEDAAILHTTASPYLYVEQPLGHAFITSHARFGSQLFRKVVAAHVGRDSFYNWRFFPEEENARCTVEAVEAWKSRNGVSRLVQTQGIWDEKTQLSRRRAQGDYRSKISRKRSCAD